MIQYRYTLRNKKKKMKCPACGKAGKFKPYIDTESGELIHETVGRCDREVNCGYHHKPGQYFKNTGISNEFKPSSVSTPLITKPPSFIDDNILRKTFGSYSKNNLFLFLNTIFPNENVVEVVNKYRIGTSKHQFTNKEYPGYKSETGTTIFWQTDFNGNIRSGKMMIYNSVSGKRIKKPFDHITWAHYILKIKDYQLRQCFFGEHILKMEPDKPIAIVESEKTAIIASLYLPEFIWLASGGLSQLEPEKCQILKERRVVLFPDVKGYKKWKELANELQHIADIVVSDLLERKATEAEREQGADLADYLIKFNYLDFITRPKTQNEMILDRMCNKNPALKTLINTFSLNLIE